MSNDELLSKQNLTDAILYAKLINGKVMQFDMQSDIRHPVNCDMSKFIYLGTGVEYSCNGFISQGKSRKYFFIRKYKDNK